MDLDAVGVEIEVAHADATQLEGAASGVEQGQDDGSISKRSRANVGRGGAVWLTNVLAVSAARRRKQSVARG